MKIRPAEYKNKYKNKNIHSVTLCLLVGLFGCSTAKHHSDVLQQITVPEQWSSTVDNNNIQTRNEQTASSWLAFFHDEKLNQLVALALKNNRQLLVKQSGLQIAEQQAIISGATKFPEISLTQGNSRRKLVSDNSVQFQNSADITLQLSYELDVWGRLSDQQNQASLDYLAAKNTYLQAKQQLTADIAKAWFSVIEAQQLLALFKARADNQTNNLAMIQSSYRLGLKDALDVYLTQNNVSSELARVAEQQQTLLIRKRSLELLLGEYPHGKVQINTVLPEINNDIPAGLPANLLTQRADIVASWYQLLALDAAVAIAHKQRFPRFALTTNAGDSSEQLSNLLDGGALAWSIIGNITLPIFNGGKLSALEQQAKLRLAQQEQQYLELVYQAFKDVENAIANQATLNIRYHHLVQAQDNAKQAETLAFDQYLKGLVSYTTVLEAQRRAFDAQTSVIQLKNQLLQNRIDLHLALGGAIAPIQTNLASDPSSLLSITSE